MPTVAEIIQIAEISQYLSLSSIRKAGLFSNVPNRQLPRLLYMVRKNVDWMNELDSSDDSLPATSNYLFALCSPHNLQAQNIIDGGAGGTVVGPTSPASSNAFPMYITSDDFTDATAYDNPSLIGQNVFIFVNEVNRNLFAGEGFTYTATGIAIRSDAGATIPGFDAEAENYNIIIYKIGS